MARFGDTVDASLGKTDFSGFLQGSAQGSQALGQGIGQLGAGAGKFLGDIGEAKKERTATGAFLEATKKLYPEESQEFKALDGLKQQLDTGSLGDAMGISKAVKNFVYTSGRKAETEAKSQYNWVQAALAAQKAGLGEPPVIERDPVTGQTFKTAQAPKGFGPSGPSAPKSFSPRTQSTEGLHPLLPQKDPPAFEPSTPGRAGMIAPPPAPTPAAPASPKQPVPSPPDSNRYVPRSPWGKKYKGIIEGVQGPTGQRGPKGPLGRELKVATEVSGVDVSGAGKAVPVADERAQFVREFYSYFDHNDVESYRERKGYTAEEWGAQLEAVRRSIEESVAEGSPKSHFGRMLLENARNQIASGKKPTGVENLHSPSAIEEIFKGYTLPKKKGGLGWPELPVDPKGAMSPDFGKVPSPRGGVVPTPDKNPYPNHPGYTPGAQWTPEFDYLERAKKLRDPDLSSDSDKAQDLTAREILENKKLATENWRFHVQELLRLREMQEMRGSQQGASSNRKVLGVPLKDSELEFLQDSELTLEMPLSRLVGGPSLKGSGAPLAEGARGPTAQKLKDAATDYAQRLARLNNPKGVITDKDFKQAESTLWKASKENSANLASFDRLIRRLAGEGLVNDMKQDYINKYGTLQGFREDYRELNARMEFEKADLESTFKSIFPTPREYQDEIYRMLDDMELREHLRAFGHDPEEMRGKLPKGIREMKKPPSTKTLMESLEPAQAGEPPSPPGSLEGAIQKEAESINREPPPGELGPLGYKATIRDLDERGNLNPVEMPPLAAQSMLQTRRDQLNQMLEWLTKRKA